MILFAPFSERVVPHHVEVRGTVHDRKHHIDHLEIVLVSPVQANVPRTFGEEGVSIQHYDHIAGTINLCRGGEFGYSNHYFEYIRGRGILPATTAEVEEAHRSLERYEQATKKKFEPI
ncbi:MAG: hypothetical protein QMC77_07795, partial [Methanocellales archaeon]|nr:hypothetical protein [Methanocellales archaeon]